MLLHCLAKHRNVEVTFCYLYAIVPVILFWPTVLSVEPIVQCVVCLSVCNVLYCGKTVHPSQKVSERANRKPGSKS